MRDFILEHSDTVPYYCDPGRKIVTILPIERYFYQHGWILHKTVVIISKKLEEHKKSPNLLQYF